MIATSIPSSEVPLINPTALHSREKTGSPAGAECCGLARAPMLDDAAMSTPRSPFLATALERGFIHQCTDMEALDARLHDGRVVAYDGFDFTADSLHVGSLVGIMLLRLFQRCAHKPAVLIAGRALGVVARNGQDSGRGVPAQCA